MTTILTALSILSSAAAPAVSDYVKEAKTVRVQHDVRTIAVALVRLANDVGHARPGQSAWDDYNLLVGAGAAPQASAPASLWVLSSDADTVGHLDDHLVTNAADYTPHTSQFPRGWRGAYLEKRVSADPWGNRYAVNVGALRGAGQDIVVLSAGPDGLITSPFARDGLPAEGDDVASLISSGAPR